MAKDILLIVDDDTDFCRDIAAAVSPGMGTLVTSSMSQALGFVRARQCCAAFLSQSLPDADALDTLRRIKEISPAFPVILAIDTADRYFILDAIHLGVFDIIEKPASLESLKLLGQRLELWFADALGIFSIRTRSASSEVQHWTNWLGSMTASLRLRLHELISNHNLQGNLAKPSPSDIDREGKCNGESPANPVLKVSMLGPFAVSFSGQALQKWPGHKAKLLFAYLCYHHKNKICRDVLMEKFWPSSSTDSARNCLNVAIHALRHWLMDNHTAEEIICFKDEFYFFNPAIHIVLDTEEFVQNWRRGQRIERQEGVESALAIYELAAALYKGDFIEEYPYESWTELDRENLREIFLFILDRISNHYALDGKPDVAITLCEQILRKDNCREDIYRRMMKCFDRIGQRDRALRTYHKCAQILHEELDVEPSTETAELYEHLRQESAKLSKN